MLEKVLNKKGNMLLTSVLILSAFTLILAVGAALTSIDNLNTSVDYLNGDIARSLADSCTQDTLYKLSRNSNYLGSVYALDEGECSVIITGTGSNSIVQIESNIDSYTSQVQFELDKSTIPYDILNWQRGY